MFQKNLLDASVLSCAGTVVSNVCMLEKLLEAGLMPLLGRVVGALTDSRGVGDSSWRGSWVEVFR